MGGSSASQAAEEAARDWHLAPERLPQPARPGTIALAVVLAGAAAFAVAALLRSAAPPATSFPPAERLQYYLDHQEDFDTLFIGTSRVYRGIVPLEFDARMAQLGMPTRSLNLGEPGMRSFEVDRLVRFLLKRNTGNLRTLFLDLGVRTPKLEQQTGRSVEWHDARQTLAALRQARALDLEPWARWQRMSTHLKQFAMRESNYGFGPLLWERVFRQPEESPEWLPARGYRSLDEETTNEFKRRRRRFLENLRGFERTVARYRDRPLQERSPEIEGKLLRGAEQARIAREAGVRAVALLSPGYGRLRGVEDEAPKGLVVLNFDDPRRHPELFEAAGRFDAVHLKDLTARHYSILVAEALAAELARPGSL